MHLRQLRRLGEVVRDAFREHKGFWTIGAPVAKQTGALLKMVAGLGHRVKQNKKFRDRNPGGKGGGAGGKGGGKKGEAATRRAKAYIQQMVRISQQMQGGDKCTTAAYEFIQEEGKDVDLYKTRADNHKTHSGVEDEKGGRSKVGK